MDIEKKTWLEKKSKPVVHAARWVTAYLQNTVEILGSKPDEPLEEKADQLVRFMGTRALWETEGPQDIAVVFEEVDPKWLEYLEHARGFRPKAVVLELDKDKPMNTRDLVAAVQKAGKKEGPLWNALMEAKSTEKKDDVTFVSVPLGQFAPYQQSQLVGAALQELGWVMKNTPVKVLETGVIEEFSHKGKFRRICESLEVPVLGDPKKKSDQYEFEIAPDDVQKALKAIKAALAEYPVGGVVVQATTSGGGVGNKFISGWESVDWGDLEDWLKEQARTSENVLIVPKYEILASPSVAVWIEQDGTVRVANINEQVLSGGSYQGILIPPEKEEIKKFESQIAVAAKEVGRALADRGFRGTVSLDFVIGRNPDLGNETMLGIVEANVRKTATVFALMQARRMVGHDLNPNDFGPEGIQIATDDHMEVSRDLDTEAAIQRLQADQIPVIGYANATDGVFLVVPPHGGQVAIAAVALRKEPGQARKWLEAARQALA